MLNFSLRQLEVFVAIARAENVSVAAQQLAMSQSAASSSLSELERRTGQPMFDRAGKRLILNEVGRMLLPRAIEMLDRGAEIETVLGTREGAVLRIGATLTIGNYIAPALIAAYRAAHPRDVVLLEIGNTRAMEQKLLQFEIDLALVEGECDDPRLDVFDWMDDELALFCAPSHPLAGRSVPIDRLLEERWVVRELGSGTRRSLNKVMEPYRKRWLIDIELGHFEAIKHYVRLGGTIGCISRRAIADEVASGLLAEIHTPDLNLHRTLHVIINRNKYRSDLILDLLASYNIDIHGKARRAENGLDVGQVTKG